ncbi:sensor domain-containing diguanylate cyclase [Halomonas mongoliensis]|jgi:diguanylate cyclase (GGDEF)-like protein/PAS domain S-box-containing protein|uniref:diguanylate cyclase n=1 Tax=Halomonas mongoliensis TaxID=321265 RepID=A0ABU1GK66_9GAMM|nr:diguanylate cyclase [Halomonas mongoliensis]MDR5892400.1 diguanylate cyclase [Halomonas mongoliensis]
MERIRQAWWRWRTGKQGASPGLSERLLAYYPGAVMLLDEEGVVLEVNPEFERHAGYPAEQLLRRRAVILDADPLHGGFARALEHCLTSRQPWQGVLLCRRADGALRHQTTMIQPIQAPPDASLRLLVMQYDVTGMRERELRDRQLLARLESTVAQLPAAIFRLHQAAEKLEFLYASDGIRALTGLAAEQVMDDADSLFGLLVEGERQALEVGLAQSAVGLSPCQQALCLDLPAGERWLELRARPQRRRDGSTLWDGVLVDITEHKQRERQVERLVGTDMLTGALNRRAFFEQAAALQARARRQGQAMPLAMLDLDRFKALNDTYGHAAGDLALQAFAATCRECLRPYDLFARIGGEEFAALLVDASLDDARAILERLREAVAAMVLEVEGADIRFTVSLGLAVLEPEANLESVLGDADRALYRAKREGRNRICGPKGGEAGAGGGDPR